MDRSAGPPPPPVDAGWADLTQVALLGTSRRAVPAGVRSGRVGLPDGPDEVVVLGAVAAIAAWRASGPKLADRPDIDVAPAGDDPRPAAPANAAQLLRMALDGGSHVGDGNALVLQWLERAAAAGYRVGHGELVPVLNWAGEATERRAAARAAIGVRGAWLAASEPSWAWAADADEEVPAGDVEGAVARFRNGGKDERPDLLRRVRALDPDLGRQLLDEARATDGAPARVALVRAMADHLSMADEPLLEAMLDDRARTVRSEVADLLSRLPDSRYGRRMAERLAPLVRTGRKSITVDLPMTFDDQATRDAIDTSDGPGKRAAARHSIVVGTPLSFWAQLGETPAQVVPRVEAEVRADLAVAASRQADATWAAAIAQHEPRPDLVALWAGTDPQGAMARCADLLRHAKQPQALLSAMTLVTEVPGPWPLAFCRDVVAAARRDPNGWSVQVLRDVGSRLDAGVLPALDAWLADLQQTENPIGLPALRSLRHSIDLRSAIDASMPFAAAPHAPASSHLR